jgi:hypothetical protein
MVIGFTGTQAGMTQEQKNIFFIFLFTLDCREFHHGDCLGADYDAHNLSVFYFIQNKNKFLGKIIIHPPINEVKRAFCKAKTILPSKPYLDRNKDIVNESELLIVCPKEKIEQLRSGTWSTKRYAVKMKKKIIIIYPDATIEKINFET